MHTLSTEYLSFDDNILHTAQRKFSDVKYSDECFEACNVNFSGHLPVLADVQRFDKGTYLAVSFATKKVFSEFYR